MTIEELLGNDVDEFVERTLQEFSDQYVDALPDDEKPLIALLYHLNQLPVSESVHIRSFDYGSRCRKLRYGQDNAAEQAIAKACNARLQEVLDQIDATVFDRDRYDGAVFETKEHVQIILDGYIRHKGAHLVYNPAQIRQPQTGGWLYD
jgi:hypothetical protein